MALMEVIDKILERIGEDVKTDPEYISEYDAMKNGVLTTESELENVKKEMADRDSTIKDLRAKNWGLYEKLSGEKKKDENDKDDPDDGGDDDEPVTLNDLFYNKEGENNGNNTK